MATVKRRLSERSMWASLVWIPMLAADSHPRAVEAAAGFDVDGIAQFYDGRRVLGQAVGRMLNSAGRIAWDVYLVYAPAAAWTGDVPAPAAWLHQLDAAWADPRLHRSGPDLVEALDQAVRQFWLR